MSFYAKVQIDTWNDLADLYTDELRKRRGWLFRGQAWEGWSLASSLERAIGRAGVDPREAPQMEDGLCRRFVRQAHHYVASLPADDAWMEWLALMQHHGAPTRLLDWTYSFWVAAYFALEQVDPTVTNRTCAIWALDGHWWHARAVDQLTDDARTRLQNDPSAKEPGTVEAILKRSPRPLVFPINPERMNERLVLQQGAFLAPADVTKGFEDNLNALDDGRADQYSLKIEIDLAGKEFATALRELHTMNVTRATLFPGLDGFSANLRNMMFVPEAITSRERPLKPTG